MDASSVGSTFEFAETESRSPQTSPPCRNALVSSPRHPCLLQTADPGRMSTLRQGPPSGAAPVTVSGYRSGPLRLTVRRAKDLPAGRPSPNRLSTHRRKRTCVGVANPRGKREGPVYTTLVTTRAGPSASNRQNNLQRPTPSVSRTPLSMYNDHLYAHSRWPYLMEGRTRIIIQEGAPPPA